MTPARWRESLADRLLAAGVPRLVAVALAELPADVRQAAADHAVLDALDAAGAAALAPQLLRRRFTPERARSLLRSVGADESRPVTPAALTAIRQSLVGPTFDRTINRSRYLAKDRHA